MKLRYFFKSDWILPAVKVALIIGTILFAINHGRAVYQGEMTAYRWMSVALTYIVPYCVYIFGKMSNLRSNGEL